MSEQERRENVQEEKNRREQSSTEIHRSMLESRIAAGEEGQKQINQMGKLIFTFLGFLYFMSGTEDRRGIIAVGFAMLLMLGGCKYSTLNGQNKCLKELVESLKEEPPPGPSTR